MALHVTGDVITVDSAFYDLDPVPEGDTPFVPPITRTGGGIHTTLIARLGEDAVPE